MNVPLKRPLIDKLTALPETGMGYQLVDLILTDGSVIRSVMVFNSEQVSVPDQYGALSPNAIADVTLVDRR